MANLIVSDMLSKITDRKTQKPVTALSPWTEYELGYNAYVMGNGPGVGLLRTAGWLQAWRDEQAELRQRAAERLDENDRHYRWQY